MVVGRVVGTGSIRSYADIGGMVLFDWGRALREKRNTTFNLQYLLRYCNVYDRKITRNHFT